MPGPSKCCLNLKFTIWDAEQRSKATNSWWNASCFYCPHDGTVFHAVEDYCEIQSCCESGLELLVPAPQEGVE